MSVIASVRDSGVFARRELTVSVMLQVGPETVVWSFYFTKVQLKLQLKQSWTIRRRQEKTQMSTQLSQNGEKRVRKRNGNFETSIRACVNSDATYLRRRMVILKTKSLSEFLLLVGQDSMHITPQLFKFSVNSLTHKII